MRNAFRHPLARWYFWLFFCVLAGWEGTLWASPSEDKQDEVSTSSQEQSFSSQQEPNIPVAETNEKKAKSKASQRFLPTGQFKQKKSRPWYKKINYFANVTQEHRNIEVSRQTTQTALANSELLANYNTFLLSFTAGGNLFKNTSINWDLTLEDYRLQGDLVETNVNGSTLESPVSFDRQKLLSEWFFEYDIAGPYSIGGDAYHGHSRYRDNDTQQVFTDFEYGAGFLVSRQFRFEQSDLRLDYILSHRILAPGDSRFERQTRTFHNLLASWQYRWHYHLHGSISARVSYFPNVDLTSFWDAKHQSSLATEISYSPWDNHQFNLKLEQVWVGSHDTIQTIGLNYEHEFGLSQTKRRKRSRRIPNLLIR